MFKLNFRAELWIILAALLADFENLVQCFSEKQTNIIKREIAYMEQELDASLRTYREDTVKKNLIFHYYKDGFKTYEDTGLEGNLLETGCLPSDKFAFIIHGWGQDCNQGWAVKLREKLTNHRSGCIVCVDYGFFKKDSYIRLLRYFYPMINTLTAKIQQLQDQGLNPSNSYIFGFSLGGQMATAIGKKLGPVLFKQIDTCDMAGPGFDYRRVEDYRPAAQQVKCFHTSRNKGTRFYSCHQNVRFGNCGHFQPGETQSISSHGLCTHYYINSFEYPFYAAQPSNACVSKNPALIIPFNYTVGYTEDLDLLIPGEIFVPTSKTYPYNLPLQQVLSLNTQSRGNNQIESNENVTRRPYKRRFPLFFQYAINKIFKIAGH